MSYTLLLYLLTLSIILVTTANVSSKCVCNKSGGLYYKSNISIVRFSFPILIYTLFWGLRYAVGTDYFAYRDDFINPCLLNDKLEIGYVLSVNILSKFKGGFTIFLLLTSFINIIAVYSISRCYGKHYLLYTIFFFWTTGTVIAAQNGIRQSLALSFFIIGLRYFILNKKFRWIILILIGSCFHKTIIIPTVVLFILRVCPRLHINRFLLLFIYIFLELYGPLYQGFVFKIFEPIVTILDYGHYLDSITDSLNNEIALSSGVGMVIRIIVTSIIILSQDFFVYNSSEKTLTYYLYIFFILGLLFTPIFSGNQTLYRVVSYFSMISFLTYSVFCITRIQSLSYQTNILLVLVVIISHLAFFSVSYNTNNCGIYKMIDLL